MTTHIIQAIVDTGYSEEGSAPILEDAVTALETILPYMFDNVVVTLLQNKES